MKLPPPHLTLSAWCGVFACNILFVAEFFVYIYFYTFAWKSTEDFSIWLSYNVKEGETRQVIDIDKNQQKCTTLNGVYETMSEIIGFDNVVKLYENFKGSQINFPTRLFSKEFVLEEALKAYDGTSESINLIATKYSYSERTIRKLLKNHLNSI